MKIVKSLRIAFTILIGSLSLFAVTVDASDDPCSDIKISAEVDACVAHQFKNADEQLNIMYKRTLKRVVTAYKADPSLAAEMKITIKNAQRAWIAFRDANCEVYAFEIEPDTVAHTTTLKACLTKMTEKRTAELSEIEARM